VRVVGWYLVALLCCGCAGPSPPARLERADAERLYGDRRAAIDRFDRSARRSLAFALPRSRSERGIHGWVLERRICGCARRPERSAPSELTVALPEPAPPGDPARSRLRRVRSEIAAHARAAGARGVTIFVRDALDADGAPARLVSYRPWPRKRARTVRADDVVEVGPRRAVGWGRYEVRQGEPLVAGLDVYLRLRVAGWDARVRLMYDVQAELAGR